MSLYKVQKRHTKILKEKKKQLVNNESTYLPTQNNMDRKSHNEERCKKDSSICPIYDWAKIT